MSDPEEEEPLEDMLEHLKKRWENDPMTNLLNMTWLLDPKTKEPYNPERLTDDLYERYCKENNVGYKQFTDDVFVSTMLLMYSSDLRGRPMFETMIFGMGDDDYQERCWTYAQALSQHNEAVKVAEIFLKII